MTATLPRDDLTRHRPAVAPAFADPALEDAAWERDSSGLLRVSEAADGMQWAEVLVELR